MAGIFGIGLSGIQAAQMGLLVTQHNIANSNTEGFNRQSIVQATTSPVGTSLGSVGTGVRVSTVQRQYNNFLAEQVSLSNAALSSLDAYYQQVTVIDDLLADPNSGVSPALQDFFKGVQQVANNPASLPARQSMVSAAEALVNRMQSADQRISDLYGQVNQAVTDSVQEINTYGSMIADLNQRIISAEAAVNQPANDLLDQRDQLISELNKIVKVNVVPIDRTGIQVFIGTGQLLVAGNQNNQMTAVRSSADPSRVSLALDLGAGAQELPDDLVTGGRLGGLMKFRTEALDKAVNSLGKVAVSMAQTFNEQHKTGMDMLGNEAGDTGFAGDFFTISNPKVIPSRLNGVAVVAATFTTPTLNSNLASGNYTSNVTNSDYRLDNLAGTLNLVRLSDKKVWTGANVGAINSQITDQGFQLANPSGAIVAGDSFLIQPTREGAKNIKMNQQISADVRLVAAALPMRATIGLTNAGSMSVAVERNRTDMSASAPSPASFPVTIAVGIFAGAQKLTSSALSTVPGPLQINVYDSNGVAVTGSPFSMGSSATATSPPIVDGYSYELADGNKRTLFSIKGIRQTGDTFTLDKNDASTGGKIGVADSGNILMLGRLQTQRTVEGGATNYQGAYAQLVSDVGNKAREIEVTQTAQKSLVAQASAAREADSGVNLDEEAANLLKYQQMYQASARAVSVGKSIFDELLAIARG